MAFTRLLPERLHVLSSPVTGEGKSYDIVLVHGLGGHFKRSWTHRNGYCWATEALAKEYPTSRVLSVEAPSLLQSLAAFPPDRTGLIADLIRNRMQDDRSGAPIICVAHSFGGVLAKQLYLQTHRTRTTNPEWRELNQQMHAFVFIGTPHKDILQADIRALWRALEQDSIITLKGQSMHLEQALSNASRVHAEFRDLGGEDAPSICFYEQLPTRIGLQERFVVTRLEACPSSAPVDLTPVELKHQYLTRFTGDQDNNLRRLLASFKKLLLTLDDRPVLQAVPDDKEERPLVLLSLDGGGVKGLFTVLILRRLLEETARLQGHDDDRKLPCDYFDLVGGTSTGGLLAIMLCRLRMDIKSCLYTYRDLSGKIFRQPAWFALSKWPQALLGQSWYSGETLEQAFCATVKENMSASERDNLRKGGLTERDVKLVATSFQRSRCFVCAVKEAGHRVDLLRSYLPSNGADYEARAYGIKLWEAARATSAAPLYFPPIQVQGSTYFDGGLDSNNPVIEVIEEAKREFPGRKIGLVISIGTGKCRPIEPKGPLHNIALSFVTRVTNTEAQHDRILSESAFQDLRAGYFRLQGTFGMGDIDLADSAKMDQIEELANAYLSSESGRQNIASCAARLAAR